MGNETGQAIVVVGPPCAGKTTLISQFQDKAPSHYLGLGMDHYFSAMAPSLTSQLERPTGHE